MGSYQAGPVQLHVDLAAFTAWSRGAIEKQIPFATALALSRCAVAARDQVRVELPEHFTIRSTWVSRGIRTELTKKSDWPNQKVQVGTVDEFMVLQETGGWKKSKSGSRVAIPTRAVPRVAGGKIPTSLRPKRLLGGKRIAAYIDPEDETIRLRKPKLKGKTGHLLLLYHLKAQAHIRARWGFRKSVETFVGVVWPGIFRGALEQALKTPKPKTRTP